MMNPQTIPVGELIYEAEIQFTSIVDYGISMAALSSRKVELPAGGARFDYGFQGDVQGPKLRGKITGTDYLYVRADGQFQLHIHAQIRTDDGHNISFASDGLSIQTDRTNETQLRATVSMFTSSPTYQWVNKLHIWAIGSLDPEKGQAFVRAFSA